MNKSILSLAIVVIGAFTAQSEAATKASKISAYAGRSTGTCTFVVPSATTASGPSNGSFKASKKKERGSLVLTSALSGGIFTGNTVETYQFNNHALTYSLTLSTGSGSGSGTAHIGKNVIAYSGTFTFFGVPYTLQGTIRQTKKRIFVSETLNNGFGTATFTYSLKRKKS